MRATKGVCRHKQLQLPDRQKQKHNLPCIREILNAGYRVSNSAFKNIAGRKLSTAYVNQTNLNGKLRKKLGWPKGGQPKIWGPCLTQPPP